MTPWVRLLALGSGGSVALAIVAAIFLFVPEEFRYWAMIALFAVAGAMYPVILKYDKRHGRFEDGGRR